jgi:hypothetical protein
MPFHFLEAVRERLEPIENRGALREGNERCETDNDGASLEQGAGKICFHFDSRPEDGWESASAARSDATLTPLVARARSSR